jgi:hypothetical protein
MPIEIRELVIKATITDEEKKKGSVGVIDDEQKEEIIIACLEQIFDILKEKEER